MKKFLSLLILLFIVISFVSPNLSINSINQTENDIDKPILLSDITCEVVIEKVENIEPTLDPFEVAINKMEEELIEISSIEDNMEWFINYKDIVSRYTMWISPPNSIYDCFTEEEINLICRVVETETFECDFDSKVNVANVVFNRLEHGEFGKTIKEIITTKNQFAYGRKNISEDTILAVEYAFMVEDTTNGALFFHSNKKTNTFCGASYIFSDDAVHHFYK